MANIELINDWLDTVQLVCTKTDGRTKYDFSNFTFLSKFILKMFRRELALQKAKFDQVNLEILISKLNRKSKRKKNDTLKSAKKLLSIREKIIRSFEKGVFLYIDGFRVEKESDEESDKESTLENEEIDTTDMPELESEESAS